MPARTYTGIVRLVNVRRGMAAAEVEGYGLVVFELMGPGELEPGQRLSGEMRSHGSRRLRDEATGRELRVFIQAYDATELNARTLLQ